MRNVRRYYYFVSAECKVYHLGQSQSVRFARRPFWGELGIS